MAAAGSGRGGYERIAPEMEPELAGDGPRPLGGSTAGDKPTGTPTRSINALQLACLGYLGVSGGPFGMEDAVGAAGALWTLVGICIIPFVWGIPQAMMTAELSTMIDDNGGYVVWVRRGMGNFWGWMAAYNSFFSNMCDMPLYLTICASYLSSFSAHTFGYRLTLEEQFAVKAVAGIIITLVNIRGAKSVAWVSLAITAIVVLPFLMEPLFALHSITPRAWLATVEQPNWGLYLSTLLWNFQGWDSLGCIAGEVQSGKVTYPLGVGLAVLMMTITYVIPVAVGVCINTNMSTWSDGMFETIAQQLSTWLGAWVLIGAVAANVGEYNVVMCTNARSLWAMGRRKMVPGVLGYSSPSYDTPVAAIVLYTITTLALVNFNFSTLVVIDTFFKNLGLALEAIAFVRLKYIEPNTPRPFTVPFGKLGSYMIAIPNLIVIGFTIYTASVRAQIICSAANVLFIILYLIRQKWFRDERADNMDAKPEDGRQSPTVTDSTLYESDISTFSESSGEGEYRQLHV